MPVLKVLQYWTAFECLIRKSPILDSPRMIDKKILGYWALCECLIERFCDTGQSSNDEIEGSPLLTDFHCLIGRFSELDQPFTD